MKLEVQKACRRNREDQGDKNPDKAEHGGRIFRAPVFVGTNRQIISAIWTVWDAAPVFVHLLLIPCVQLFADLGLLILL